MSGIGARSCEPPWRVVAYVSVLGDPCSNWDDEKERQIGGGGGILQLKEDTQVLYLSGFFPLEECISGAI